MRMRFRARRPRELLPLLPLLPLLALVAGLAGRAPGEEGAPRWIEEGLRHLRAGGEERQWDDFPERAEGDRLEVVFEAKANEVEQTLWLRQHQVRHTWQITLNGAVLGRLSRDERDQTVAWALPPGALAEGANTLVVEATRAPTSDDVRVGQIRIDPRTVAAALRESEVSVRVTDADTGEAIPCRLTVLDAQGSLVSLGAESDDRLAVRPGTVYTLDGEAVFGLPAGSYTLHAGRGAEYSMAERQFEVSPGGTASIELALHREVSLPGYVGSDIHLHTLTHSGHGDSTLTERMVTIAGEGFELPVATDHDVHVDYTEEANRIGANRHFTPVIGNEVTTGVGHFIIFPVKSAEIPAPDSGLVSWPAIFDAIEAVPGVRAVVLAHGRDAHRGFTPLGAQHFNAASGKRVDGRELRANAMEVVNSGAIRTDPLEYVRDWMAMLNRGLRITPAGGSDSHDVARKFAGQARTYIAVDDTDPGSIDVDAAVDSFVEGRVLVGFGLVAEVSVNGTGPGGTVAAEGPLEVAARVLGPSWLKAERVLLFANGEVVREVEIDPGTAAAGGVKWSGSWALEPPSQDLHLAVVALGPGSRAPWWKVSRPYQADGPEWRPYVLGLAGAVYVDAEGDGRWKSPREHASRLLETHDSDIGALLRGLEDYDRATAVQAACLLEDEGTPPDTLGLQEALAGAAPVVREGFALFRQAWEECRDAPPFEDPTRRLPLREQLRNR